MKSLRRALLKVAVFVPLAILASVLAIGGAGLVSFSSATRIGVHSLHSFWPCIPAAVCLQLLRKRTTLSLVALFCAFLFLILVNIGAACSYIGGYVQLSSVMPAANQAMDILDTTLTGLIFVAAFIPQMSRKECGFRYTVALIFMLTGIPLVIYTVSWFSFLLYASYEAVMITAVVIGIAGTAIFAIITAISLLRRISFISVDQGYLGSATLLTAVSLPLFMISLISGTEVWIYAENLQVAALFLYGLSLAIPYLRQAGFSRLQSYLIIVGFSVFTYLPLTITISIEAGVLVIDIDPSNFIAFGIIHLGASFLSGMIAVLLYIYSRRKPTSSLFPLILLYSLWTFVAVSSILTETLRFLVTMGEPIVSYIVGSIVTLVVLLYTCFKSQDKPAGWDSPSPKYVISGVLTVGSLVLVGEILNFLIVGRNPSLAVSPLGSIVLFGVNLLVLFLLLSLFFALSEHAGGRTTIEIAMLLFLSVWIVPNILKSYYVNWSAGWWISQLIVFIGLLVGPALLGLLYIRALQETEESHTRARLYADLLMHDVSNYHQMLLTSLELMGDGTSGLEKRRELSKEAKKVVSLADQLIANVRLMAQTDEITPSKLKRINLVSVVVEALDEVMEGIGNEAVEFQYMPEIDYAPIMGDELLKHAFINILLLAIQQPLKKDRVEVSISKEVIAGEDWWKTRLVVPGSWSAYDEMAKPPRMDLDGYSATKLSLLVVSLIVTSLGGRLIFHVAEDDYDLTEFLVLLPSLEVEKSQA